MNNNLFKKGNRTGFKKGYTPWNKGRKLSEETRLKMSISRIGHPVYGGFKKGDNAREKNNGWMGDKVSYSALHCWISKYKGKPSICEHCGTTKAKRFEWANKSHNYLRELSDWIRLCPSCHHRYDRKQVMQPPPTNKDEEDLDNFDMEFGEELDEDEL